MNIKECETDQGLSQTEYDKIYGRRGSSRVRKSPKWNRTEKQKINQGHKTSPFQKDVLICKCKNFAYGQNTLYKVE